MELFSHRKGIKPVKNVMQVDSIDDDLRNSLWNALSVYYWDKMEEYDFLSSRQDINFLFKLLWHNYFKYPLDTLDNYWKNTYNNLREYFFKCEWNEVYDFIEFVGNSYSDQNGDKTVNKNFMDFCNTLLSRELSGYRFIDGKITQITSEEEITAIEEALEETKSIKPAFNHLKRSLELLADRKSPDYRNSIKESISSVEAICNLITKNTKTTLGQALKEIEKKTELHPALKKAFESLYGYTSDADGIRHALLDEPDLDFEDAKFMLVSCSGFINYLITKASKAGVKF